MSLKFCNHCGSKLEDSDIDFCSLCGADLRDRKKGKSGAPPPKQEITAAVGEKKSEITEQYADFLHRFYALGIDLLIFVGIFFILLIIGLRDFGLIFMFLLTVFLYFWLIESINKGQTIGKMIIHLRTVDKDTLVSPSIVKSLLNNILKWFPPFFILDLIIGVIVNIGDPQKRLRIAQNLSNTVVIRDKK